LFPATVLIFDALEFTAFMFVEFKFTADIAAFIPDTFVISVSIPATVTFQLLLQQLQIHL